MKLFSKLGAALLALVFSGAMALGSQVIDGHLGSTGTIPVLSTCGTSPAILAGSTDTAGRITVGTSASNACTLTFAVPFAGTPVCVVQNMTTGAGANVYAVTSTTIIWSSALADSTVLAYHCIGLGG